MKPTVNVLVIDIGGTHVKVLATGQRAHREFDSGPALTPKRMIGGVRKLVADWKYEAVSIGFPGGAAGVFSARLHSVGTKGQSYTRGGGGR